MKNRNNDRAYKPKSRIVPDSVDVTMDGVTLNFTEDDCINPDDWISIEELNVRIIKADDAIKHLTIRSDESESDFIRRINSMYHKVIENG